MTAVSNWLVSQSPLSALLLKATLVFAIACLVHSALYKASSHWRVLVWRGALLAIVALPLVTRVAPPLDVEMTNAAARIPAHVTVTEMASHERNVVNAGETGPRSSAVERASTSFLQHGRELLNGLWGVVALALFAASLCDAWRLRRMLRTVTPAPKHLTDCARELAADLRLSRHFALLTMPGLGSPFVTGIMQPVLVLPQRVVDQNDPVQLRAILAHELAHIKSNDVPWMAVARIVACLLWFHPLAWIARASHRAACEEVCDGVAAAQVDNPEAYAQVLAAEALALFHARPAPGAVPMVRAAEILRRIRRIRNGIRVNPLARRWIAAAFMVTSVLLLGLATVRFVHAQQAPVLDDYVIEVEIYQPEWAHFQPGDSIEILEVRGTAPDFRKGERYYVRGRYTLASHESALLHVYATGGEVSSKQGPAVDKGKGEFVRTFTIGNPGEPHVSFYPAGGGDGFGGTYFRRAGSPNWHPVFNAVYFLNDNEVLKRVAPPFIPERLNYYFADSPGQAEVIPSGPTYMIFHWDGGIRNAGMGFAHASRPHTVEKIITQVLQVNRGEFDGPASVLEAPLPGDWIIRIPSASEERMRAFAPIAFAEILRNEPQMKLRLDRQPKIRPVVVVSGTYHFTPLANAPRSPATVHLYSNKLDPRGGAGGGAGTLDQMLEHLRIYTQIGFVNETAASSDFKIEWVNHSSARLQDESSARTRKRVLDNLLINLHDQTGLNFSIQDREVDTWVFSEDK